MLSTNRRGVTLIELLIFIVVFGLVAGLLVPFMVFTGESMVRQQSDFTVQRNGDYVLQVFGQQIKDAERVLTPSIGGTGTVLALQRSADDVNPTIIGVRDGQIVIVNHTTEKIISTPDVIVSKLIARNTSASATRQSASITFTISRRVQLLESTTDVRTFQTTFTLFPNDDPQGGLCGCAVPACTTTDTFTWHPCTSGACGTSTAALTCKP